MPIAEFAHVSTGGTHREMGVDFGRAVAGPLADMREDAVRHYLRLTKKPFAASVRFASRHFLPVVQKRYPAYLSEVRGIAEGAKLPFEEVFFLTVDEELSALWERRGPDHCSSVAMRRKGKWLVGHNEDYPPRYHGRLAVVDAQPNDAPAFLSLTYPYMLAGVSCGMNAAGMAFTANSLQFPAKRSGVPGNYVLRDAFAATSLIDAERRLAQQDSLMSNAGLLVSVKEDRAVALECMPAGVALHGPDTSGTLVHTNHSLAGATMRKGERPTRSSRNRLVALQAFAPGLSGRMGLQTLLSSSSKGLLLPVRGHQDSCTVATAVMDVNARAMYVAKRGPEGHGFKKYLMR